MKLDKQTLYFIGHKGVMNALPQNKKSVMLVPDANLVLALLKSRTYGSILSDKHQHYLIASKRRVRRCLQLKQPWIPVNPVVAILELSKQLETQDYSAYLKLHNDILVGVYGITDLEPEWVKSTYLAAMKAQLSIHPSIALTIKKTHSLIPANKKPKNQEILKSCEEFFNWIWLERDQLTIIGGPLIYVCVYAIAGSPEARKFIKYAEANVLNTQKVADNVAWDLLYWMTLEIEYHRNAYQDTIICTSDYSLAQLLGSRINKGQRGQMDKALTTGYAEVSGDFFPFKLRKLENTKLEAEVGDRLLSLLSAIEAQY